jgi:uroporphyrinogen decarboxylase
MKTARDRVKTAFAHRKPDRLPRYEIFFQSFIDAWRAGRGLPGDADIYEAYPKIDIGTRLASQEGPFISRASREERGVDILVRDTWGRLQRHSRTGKFFEVLETAIRDKSGLDTLEFEDPRDPARYAGIVQREREIRDRFAPVSGVMGLFMPCYFLRGELPFFIDLAEDPGFCNALIRKLEAFLTVVGEEALRRTNTWDTALWVFDDFGDNRGPLISPAMFETYFLEPYKRMIAHWKSMGARHIILHYDGNCWAILDMLLEAGFTGIQGIYPAAGMTVPDVKARYGDRLSIVGGICNMSVLARGTRQSIENHVRAIAEAGRDGGVVIGAHSVEGDVPVENYDLYGSLLDEIDRHW